jgi:prepilin-type N-terminal cleavage/methylation domain-containing protein/prepilin-type processing-associated H-X9-DG protein
MNRSRAFTLIELLVVIAIIAILAAILFPVFAQAKLAAKKAASVSNAKQLMLSSLLYVNDFDDRWVPSFVFPNDWGNCPWYVWFDLVYPYMKNRELLADPANSQTLQRTGNYREGCRELQSLYNTSLVPGTPSNPLRLGYGYNEGYNDDASICPAADDTCYFGMRDGVNNDGFSDPGVNMSSVSVADTITYASLNRQCPGSGSGSFSSGPAMFRNPRDTDLMTSVWSSDPAASVNNPGSGCVINGQRVGRVSKLYGGLGIFAFADGHVKALKTSQPAMWTRMED